MLDIASKKTGWTTVAFGDVVRRVKDKVDPAESGLERYVAGEHMETDDLRIRRWGDIGDGYLGPAFHMRFKPGHVLYGSRRTYLRKVAVADFEGITANTTYVLESADPDALLSEMIPFIMQTDAFNQHSVRESKGSVNPYVNFSDLAWFEFTLPPIEDQRQMLEALASCEALSESLRVMQSCCEKIYDSMLVDIFGIARGVECDDPETRHEHGNTWKWAAVDQHYYLQLGKMSSQKAREGENHAPYIKNNNVLWNNFVLEDLPVMSFNAKEREKFSLKIGDLLVCEGGEIGKAAVWETDVKNVFYQKALHRLRPLDKQSNTRFMMHYLRACSMFGILEKIATGTTILHLPRERLAKLRLPFPSADAQKEYAVRLDEIIKAIVDIKSHGKMNDGVKKILLGKVVL